MELLFWGIVAIIAYTYFGYPLLIAAMAAMVRNGNRKEESEPSVTVLITAYNEEKEIAGKLENTLLLDYPPEKREIIVASDASSDATDAIVKRFACRGVRLLRVEGRVGKTEVQNRAVQIARGEIIVFSDATTKYEKDALRNMVRNYADPSVGAVAGRFKYVDHAHTGIGAGTVAFWDYENIIKSAQTRIGTVTGCSGCFYSARRRLYEPLPADIISDLVEPLAIIRKGYRVVFEPAALAYEWTYQKPRDEFQMRIRVISRGMRGFIYMKTLLNPLRHPWLAFQIISHKILRWFVPFFALLLYLVNLALVDTARLYYLSFIAQSIFYLLAYLGWRMELHAHRVKMFSLPFYFCVINTASVVALLRTLMHKKDIQWKTVRG